MNQRVCLVFSHLFFQTPKNHSGRLSLQRYVAGAGTIPLRPWCKQLQTWESAASKRDLVSTGQGDIRDIQDFRDSFLNIVNCEGNNWSTCVCATWKKWKFVTICQNIANMLQCHVYLHIYIYIFRFLAIQCVFVYCSAQTLQLKCRNGFLGSDDPNPHLWSLFHLRSQGCPCRWCQRWSPRRENSRHQNHIQKHRNRFRVVFQKGICWKSLQKYDVIKFIVISWFLCYSIELCCCGSFSRYTYKIDIMMFEKVMAHA